MDVEVTLRVDGMEHRLAADTRTTVLLACGTIVRTLLDLVEVQQ